MNPLLSLLTVLPLISAEVYPQAKNAKPPHITPFNKGDSIPISCIQRQIDTGEHKFDDQNQIIYAPFPVCRETGEPFSLKYGTSEDVNCTIELVDETYHLFQLYIHQDVPFSCRVPYSKSSDSVYIPLTLNFRGILETSHLDIDTAMNVVVHEGSNSDTIISSIGYSTGGNVSRYIIGDFMPIRFHVNWFEEYHKSKDIGHYDLSLGFTTGTLLFVSGVVGLIVAGIVVVMLYGVFNRKLIKDLGYKPGFSTELGIEKRD